MRPFLTIHRQEIIDLPAPWDPAKVLDEYLQDPARREDLALSKDQLATLTRDGVVVRIDARHRWMGAMVGQLRIAVLEPSTLEVDIDGSAAVPWWLRPLVLPFRRRMRRAVEAQIDQLIEELETDPSLVDTGAEEPTAEGAPEPSVEDAARPAAGGPASRRDLTWTLEVLTTGGELVYQRVEGTAVPV